ncbi:hypothetical protein I552_2097 [Mycobacterium xenopi 3993]|nr:hypothetical protein I552_2097 [Mycobacterium xenopi 3993]
MKEQRFTVFAEPRPSHAVDLAIAETLQAEILNDASRSQVHVLVSTGIDHVLRSRIDQRCTEGHPA